MLFRSDLLQETFIKATRSLDGYQGGNPRSWLFTIARSVFIDAVRRTRAVPVEDIPDAGTLDPDAGERMLVGHVLGALPPRQRRAILLVDEAGLSYQEAADVMGTTLGAMKVLLHRARSNFRSIYSENTDD